MARKQVSVRKREREQKKRERDMLKAERAAEKKEQKLAEAAAPSEPQITDDKSDQDES